VTYAEGYAVNERPFFRFDVGVVGVVVGVVEERVEGWCVEEREMSWWSKGYSGG
jgi:hypothetical protein